jgi:RNA polymerase-interacting CarD/CdnL/TRCF family regulator
MDFNLGEQVIHPNFGIGKVITVEDDLLMSRPRPFTGWILVNHYLGCSSASAGGIRPVTPFKDLGRYRKLLKSTPDQLDEDFRKRQEQLGARLGKGTFEALCQVVRDLSARLQSKHLNKYESAMLKQTREALVQEWALTSGISPGDAGIEIDRTLEKGWR